MSIFCKIKVIGIYLKYHPRKIKAKQKSNSLIYDKLMSLYNQRNLNSHPSVLRLKKGIMKTKIPDFNDEIRDFDDLVEIPTQVMALTGA